MFLNHVFDLSNLLFALDAYKVTLREAVYAAPIGQDLTNAHNDALHLGRVNKLAVDATLELLNDLIKVDDLNVLVEE